MFSSPSVEGQLSLFTTLCEQDRIPTNIWHKQHHPACPHKMFLLGWHFNLALRGQLIFETLTEFCLALGIEGVWDFYTPSWYLRVENNITLLLKRKSFSILCKLTVVEKNDYFAVTTLPCTKQAWALISRLAEVTTYKRSSASRSWETIKRDIQNKHLLKSQNTYLYILPDHTYSALKSKWPSSKNIYFKYLCTF